MLNSIDRTTNVLGYLGKAVAIASLALAACFAGPLPTKADDDGSIRLVTQNMYVGSSFAALTLAQTPQQVAAAVATIHNNILASKPAERVASMAREIARHRPDLVALQEARIPGDKRTKARTENVAPVRCGNWAGHPGPGGLVVRFSWWAILKSPLKR